ncbi:MAG: hypothetical protein Q7R81_05850 [Candidatus Peregrinibacteria bacterium]|nr:hypothetical protein [Candidatus Peregrinibacteria bacterium]
MGNEARDLETPDTLPFEDKPRIDTETLNRDPEGVAKFADALLSGVTEKEETDILTMNPELQRAVTQTRAAKKEAA